MDSEAEHPGPLDGHEERNPSSQFKVNELLFETLPPDVTIGRMQQLATAIAMLIEDEWIRYDSRRRKKEGT